MPVPNVYFQPSPCASTGVASGSGPDAVARRGAVGLAEAVSTGDERDGLLVVHRHPAERLPDVAGRLQRVGLAVRTLGVYVDEAHLHGAERVGELAVAAVPLVPEPGVLLAPEDLLGLPGVLAPEAEAEGTEAIDSSAQLPANTSRSAQEIFCPYFCLTGQSSRRALSRFALSGQLFSGANRCWPAPAPPRPSSMRYVPAECQLIRMNSGP